MPQPQPSDRLSADSPTSMVYTGPGKATVSDANGIAKIVQFLDLNHATTTYLNQSCGNPKTSLSVSQYYPIDGQKFSVTDCSGNVRSFKFQVTT